MAGQILGNLVACEGLIFYQCHEPSLSWSVAQQCLPRSWWHHQMETFSVLLAICVGNSPVSGEFPAQRQVTRSFHVFFDLRLNKLLSKQSWGWWFEMQSCPLWRHCNVCINSSPPGQNSRLFAHDIFRCIFVNEKFCILVKISLKFVPKDNNPALVQIMAWHRIGNKPLPEPMLTWFTDAYMRH